VVGPRLKLEGVTKDIEANSAMWRVIVALYKRGKVVENIDYENAEDGYHLLIVDELTAEEETVAREAAAQHKKYGIREEEGIPEVPLTSDEYTEEELKRRVAENPDDPEVYSDYAFYLDEFPDRYRESEPFHRRAAELDPTNANAQAHYADILRRLRRLEEARTYYDRALELDAENTCILNSYAFYLGELGLNDETEEVYKKIIKAEPDDPSWHNNYAVFLACVGRQAEAAFHFARAGESSVETADVTELYNYASLFKEQGKFGEAEDYYKSIIAFGEGAGTNLRVLALAYRDYAEILYEQGRLGAAEKHYRLSLELDEQTEIHFAYATVLEALGRVKVADRHYEKAKGME
jgi:tetratricopeptide (TPR) repeat protein